MMRTLVLGCCLVAGTALADGVPEPEGFRDEPYHAAVPDSLAGATTVGTEEAHRLWNEGMAVFVDVLPREARPEGLPKDAIWRIPPHVSIPGATWLPNTGYARLSVPEQDYLDRGLALLTGDDPGRPLLFFCRTECWMSWNAAKRALAMGYSEVLWYPPGADGWAAAGHPLESIEPLP